MRIVHLNPFYFPYAGGIERRIRSTARRLARRHDVHIVTAQLPGTRAGEEAEDGYTVHRLPSRFPLRRFYNPPLVRTSGLRSSVARIRPDVVDYHFRWSGSYNRAFRGMAAVGRIVTYHNTYGEGLGVLGALSRLNDRLYMRTLRRARRVVCVSRRVRDDLIQHGADADRLRVNHNAVETDEIAGIDGPAETPLPGRYVMSVGRLVALKGFDVLLDAWPRVDPGLHLVIVGQGPKLGALRRRAKARHVADRVHFPGWVGEAEKIRLLKGAVAYAHPARFESFPFAILEALAAGSPVVAARVGGIPEVVGDAGVLLDHSPDAWARAVDAIARDDAERRRLSTQSRARSRRFDWDDITADLEAIYAEAQAG